MAWERVGSKISQQNPGLPGKPGAKIGSKSWSTKMSFHVPQNLPDLHYEGTWKLLKLPSPGSPPRVQLDTLGLSGWWFQMFFIFTPTSGNDPIWRAYFSNRLKPPTRYLLYTWTRNLSGAFLQNGTLERKSHLPLGIAANQSKTCISVYTRADLHEKVGGKCRLDPNIEISTFLMDLYWLVSVDFSTINRIVGWIANSEHPKIRGLNSDLVEYLLSLSEVFWF